MKRNAAAERNTSSAHPISDASYRRFRLLATSTLLVLLCAIAAPAAGALTTSQAKCRLNLAKGARKVALRALTQINACHKLRMRGSIAASVNCSDTDDPGFPAANRAKIDTLAAALVPSASNACASESVAVLGYASCASPCDVEVPTLASFADVSRCLSCLAQARASALSLTSHGATPPTSAYGTNAWTCQKRVEKASRRYLKSRMGWQRSCQYSEDKGKIGATNCVSADLNGKIATALLSCNATIAKCTDTDLAGLTTCGANVGAEQSCIDAAVQTATDDLFAAIFPEPPPTPTPTATTTPTPTPTLDPSCPAFLDVSGAAGPGGSYSSLAPSLSVSCSASAVTVHSNGIPTYQYVALTPNGLQAKNYNFTFPRNPAAAASTTSVPLLGNIGVALNGIPIYGVNEGPQPASDAYGDPIAAAILDQCGSHSAQQGTFHYHQMLVKCLLQSAVSSSQPWNNADPSTTQPSPVVGYAFDGFAIYGPYECTDAGCTSVQRMLSSWDNTGYQAGTVGCATSSACSGGYCNDVMINGSQTTACVPKTCVWSNNTYTAKAGSQYLDRCNGHYGPNGDYHYHTTETFPYTLGCYRGTPTNNGGMGTPPGGSCP